MNSNKFHNSLASSTLQIHRKSLNLTGTGPNKFDDKIQLDQRLRNSVNGLEWSCSLYYTYMLDLLLGITGNIKLDFFPIIF